MLNGEDYFKGLYDNSKQNSILTIDKKGIIQGINQAFTDAYGYTIEDLKSKHFRLLYTKKDQTLLRPEIELNRVLRAGASSDENYLVHKDGTPIWVTGEAVLARNESETGIVKVIHNMDAQKQLERYLLASYELLDDLFNSTTSALLLLDSSLRTVKANSAFVKMFGCQSTIIVGSKLQDVDHPFWSEEEVKIDIRNVVTKGEKLNKEYMIGNNKNDFRKIQMTSKVLCAEDAPVDAPERRLLLVIKEL